MNKATNGHGERRGTRNFTWALEVLLIVTVIPALVHGVNSLTYLPVA